MQLFRRPMLAATEIPDETYLRNALANGPLLVTPKWDGIRILTGGGNVVTRTLKRVRNRYIESTIAKVVGDLRLDGECVCIDANGGLLPFNPTQSAVMAYQGQPHFRYFIFDTWDVDDDYQGRVGWLYRNVPKHSGPFHEIVLPEWAFDYEELMRIHADHLAKGYEGSCARPPGSPYKNGRATLPQGWLLKLKPFVDEEAEVIGYTPLMRNQNDPQLDALGLTKRSKRQDGLVEDPDCFGALICENEKWGVFSVGSGFTELQRCNPAWWVGQIITYKYQPNHSVDKPHAATFKAVRHPDDYDGE